MWRIVHSFWQIRVHFTSELRFLNVDVISFSHKLDYDKGLKLVFAFEIVSAISESALHGSLIKYHLEYHHSISLARIAHSL